MTPRKCSLEASQPHNNPCLPDLATMWAPHPALWGSQMLARCQLLLHQLFRLQKPLSCEGLVLPLSSVRVKPGALPAGTGSG